MSKCKCIFGYSDGEEESVNLIDDETFLISLNQQNLKASDITIFNFCPKCGKKLKIVETNCIEYSYGNRYQCKDISDLSCATCKYNETSEREEPCVTCIEYRNHETPHKSDDRDFPDCSCECVNILLINSAEKIPCYGVHCERCGNPLACALSSISVDKYIKCYSKSIVNDCRNVDDEVKYQTHADEALESILFNPDDTRRTAQMNNCKFDNPCNEPILDGVGKKQ